VNALAPFAPGDIFVTASDLDEAARFPTGRGKILQFDRDWSPKGSFETGHRGLISSLTIDAQGNLHALDPQARARTTIGPDGRARAMFGKLSAIALGSMIALPDGNFLIGEHMVGEIPGFSGRGKAYRVTPDGEILAEYDTETNGGMGGFLGVTHMALSVDGQTLYHTSETGAHVYAHDLANNKRLGPVYTRNDPPPLVFGIAALPDGSLLVACGNEMRRVMPGSEAARSYQLPEGRGWAVPMVSGDGSWFWALDFFGGKVASIDTESGAVLELQDLGLAKCLTGIAEFPASAQ
jgi:hypothetical protein